MKTLPRWLIIVVFSIFMSTCAKGELNSGNPILTLDLFELPYLSLLGKGGDLVLPNDGDNGLYIYRVDDFTFVIYDLQSPNIDPRTGKLCILPLIESPITMRDRCTGIAYTTLTGAYIPSTVPATFIGNPSPLIAYSYNFITDASRQILIIYKKK